MFYFVASFVIHKNNHTFCIKTETVDEHEIAEKDSTKENYVGTEDSFNKSSKVCVIIKLRTKSLYKESIFSKNKFLT